MDPTPTALKRWAALHGPPAAADHTTTHTEQHGKPFTQPYTDIKAHIGKNLNSMCCMLHPTAIAFDSMKAIDASPYECHVPLENQGRTLQYVAR